MSMTPSTAAFLAVFCGATAALAQQPPANVRLQKLARYETGRFAQTASEISAYDPASRRVFVTNSAENTLDILKLKPQRLSLVSQVDLSPWGGGPNSVAARNGLVAVAVQATPITDPGRVVFFDASGTFVHQVQVGALPDMLIFTPDGSKLLVANEGEPSGGVDPAGSVSIIDLANGTVNATVTTAGFAAFTGREAELRAKGVRVFPSRPAGLDLEPEYIAVSQDATKAFVTLQEANALAVVDIATASVLEIFPCGLKNHARGLPGITNHIFPAMPALGTTATANPSNPLQTVPGQQILLGGFSGLWFEGVDPLSGKLKFVTMPDRGPNGEPTNVDADTALERPFVLPGYQPRIVRFELDAATSTIELTQTILLKRADGLTPLTGLPNIAGVDEEPVDLFGNVLTYDPLGADLEGVAVAADGTFWCVDEYRPAIYHFAADGTLLKRLVPQGTGALAGQPAGTFGDETLPPEYSKRRPNRGFEAVALDPTANVVYAFIQTPLANPNTTASNNSDVIRVLGVDAATGAVVSEHVYLLEGSDFRDTKVDKLGDAVFAGNGRFFVLERDDTFESYAKKMVYDVDLQGATNLRAPGAPALLPGKTLEQHTADDLALAGIKPVNKVKVVNLPSIGYARVDKAEGLALLADGRLAVLNDNDFNVEPSPIPIDGTIPLRADPTPIALGIVDFTRSNALDASDRDSLVNIRNWPVYGVPMPDAIASFTVDGRTYYATANEGDDRGEDVRIGSLALDPVKFPDAVTLKAQANLGRLGVSSIDGKLDGDTAYDQLWAYGGRSMSIFDQFGNLVSDTGDLFERVTAARYPTGFNSDHSSNDSFDTRSDNKGPEPEAVAVGTYRGRIFAFVGLERIGGIVILDVTDPVAPRYVGYENTRRFGGDPAAGTAGDLGPEGLLFVPKDDSPVGQPLLIVTHEVSGSTTVFRVIPAGTSQ